MKEKLIKFCNEKGYKLKEKSQYIEITVSIEKENYTIELPLKLSYEIYQMNDNNVDKYLNELEYFIEKEVE